MHRLNCYAHGGVHSPLIDLAPAVGRRSERALVLAPVVLRGRRTSTANPIRLAGGTRMPRSARSARALSSVMVVLFIVSLGASLGASPVAAATSLLGGARLATALPSPATFNTNLLLAGSSSAGEPSIRTDRFGRSFVICPTGRAAGGSACRG